MNHLHFWMHNFLTLVNLTQQKGRDRECVEIDGWIPFWTERATYDLVKVRSWFINLTIEILVIWRVYFRMNIYVQSHFTKNTSALCPIYEIICTVNKLSSFEAIKGSLSLLWNEKYCILNKYKIRYIMKMQGLLLRK